MFLRLPREIKYEILEYLNNEELYELQKWNKCLHELIHSSYFKEYLQYRDHPIVFNKHDNLCNICNLKFFIVDLSLNFSTCNHIFH